MAKRDRTKKKQTRKRRDDSRSVRRRGRDRGGSKRSGGKFSYNRSQESVRKRAEQSGGNADYFVKDQYKVFRPTESNHIRILPPNWDDAEHFAYDVYVNYGIGPDNSTYLSLSAMLDEDDPIAEERRRAEKEGDLDYAEDLKPTKRPCCFVIDRNNENDGVQIYPMPWSLDRDIAALMIDRHSGEVLPIDDLEEGYDVFFDRKGKGKRMKYTGIEIDRNPSPVFDDEDEMDDLVEYLEGNSLPDCLLFHDYDHIAKVFDVETHRASSGEDEGEDEDVSEDYDWESIHDMSSRKLERLIDDEELDLDPDDFDDDEELADAICEELDIDEPRKSRSSSGKSNRRKLRDMRRGRDEDEDEDEEDDTEDDEPKRSRRRARKRRRR